MSNVVAAIGLAQVERADDYREMRIKNHKLYREQLLQIPGITMQSLPADNCIDVCWMNTIVLDPEKYHHTKDETIAYLKSKGIDTRLLFNGMHHQKSMKDYGCDCSGDYPVSDWLTKNGFYLPSASSLPKEDIDYVCQTLKSYQSL